MVATYCPTCGRDTLVVEQDKMTDMEPILVDDRERCPVCGGELFDDEPFSYVQPCRLPEVEPYLVHFDCRRPWEHFAVANRLPYDHPAVQAGRSK